MVKVVQKDPLLSRGQIYYYLRSRLSRDHQDLLDIVSRIPGRDNKVHAIGIITLSSMCVHDCIYCGFRAGFEGEGRFRLAKSEIMESADRAAEAGVKWMVIKSGDDPGIPAGAVAEIVRALHKKGLYVSLSMGERNLSDYESWKRAGAEFYWMRHETCDPHLYRRVRPAMFWVDRIRNMELVKESGYGMGTGMLIGMPNQSFESLLEDLLLLSDLEIMGLSVEPYRPPVDSPGYSLIQKPENAIIRTDRITLEKVVALSRTIRPRAAIVITKAHEQAYGVLDDGALFRAGANAVLFDFTPEEYAEFAASSPMSGLASRDGAMDQAKDKLGKNGIELVFDLPEALTA